MSRVIEWEIERVWEWDSERARESESEKVWGWVLSIEMKTKVVQHVKSDWMRDWMSVRVRKSEIVRVRMRVSNIGKRKKTLKNFQVPSFCLTFRHFLFKDHYCKEREVWVWRHSDNYFYIIFIFDWSQVWVFLAFGVPFFCKLFLWTKVRGP